MRLNQHRLFVLVSLFSLTVLTMGIATVQAQEGRPGSPSACPFPFTRTLPPASGAFVNVPDMPAGWSSHPHQGIGGAAVNTWGGYSFDLRKELPGQCCQITSARLTVTFKALQGGACGSSSSGNDAWSIVHGGVAVTTGIVPGTGALPCPVTTGQLTTKVVTVTNPQVLNSGFLSIYVEDDTEIVSANLVISGCCVNMR